MHPFNLCKLSIRMDIIIQFQYKRNVSADGTFPYNNKIIRDKVH